MPAKIVVETVEKEVKMMTDAVAEFVSLVKHGASRMPFRVIKSQKGGTAKTMPMIVQSILLPKSMKLEEVSALKGNEWLAEAAVEKSQSFDDYTKLVQADASKFDGSTMKMMMLPGGALALVGQLAEGVDPNGMLTVSEQVEKDNPLATPLDAVVETVTEETTAYSYDVTFRDLLWREMDGLNDVIFGTLKQASADPKKRKAAILNAVDAFRNFMAMGLDTISANAIKVERETVEKQEGDDEMFKTKEEFVEAVVSIIDEKLAAKADKKLTPEEQAALDAKSKKDEEVVADKGEINIAAMIGAAIDKAISPLVQKIEAVAVKQDELGNQLGIEATAAKEEEEPEPVKKDEKTDEKPSVFGGLLTGKVLSKRSLTQNLHGA